MKTDKTLCRNPDPEKAGVRIPSEKYRAVKAAIMDAVDHAGPDGLYFKDLAEAVKTRLSASQLKTLGSLGWHVTVVKLELEAAGDIIRAQGKGPHRLLRAAP